ncbi:MAG TPA: 4-hydroxy-3-methylbut-2-enyl diphosphate reductase [Chloroflexota bacterium]|nr:4-hydroxy-3-methylbut-2-enyl diphosphate reductase [Chloroflexota bacterium]
MQILRAPRFSGFCGGVKRAWSIAARTRSNADGAVYVSGELINNDPAMRELAARGVNILRVGEGEAPEGAGTLIMRAHGEGPHTFERAAALGLHVVDATCGIVRVVQEKAKRWEDEGYQVILYGHRDHPEAKATVAYTQHGRIIESVEEAQALPHFARIASLAQTTALLSEYQRVCEVLRTKADVFEDQGQVCAWTRMAQEEAVDLAQRCTVMVVVGGRKSANTHRLVEVCAEHVPSYLVETVEDLDPAWFEHDSVVGVTAGASTREQDVQDVMARIEAIGEGLA